MEGKVLDSCGNELAKGRTFADSNMIWVIGKSLEEKFMTMPASTQYVSSIITATEIAMKRELLFIVKRES